METELKLGPPGESLQTDGKKSVFKVVGWPPYRQGTSSPKKKKKIYVKVSMDGAPFLRKLELTSFSGYSSLYSAVHAMFESGNFTECFFFLVDLCMYDGWECLGGLTQNDYSVIYEDNDGDWMLVGDVPWM